MIQEIAVYIIVGIAIIIFVVRMIKSFGKKGGACDSCPSDCSCELKDKINKKKD